MAENKTGEKTRIAMKKGLFSTTRRRGDKKEKMQ